MFKTRTLVIFAGMAMVIALLALTLVSAPPATFAQGPTPAPEPIKATVKIVAVPGNAAGPTPITTTVQYITDTVVGAARSTAALYTSGLSNVPIKVPVRVECVSPDAKNAGKPAWTLLKPADSKATLVFTNTQQTVFTPDVVGAYMVNCNLGTGFVVNGVQINAGTYIGVTAGNCKQCHAKYTEEWAKTNHATLFSRELDNKVDGPLGIAPSAAGFITHYSETCTRCHTTGWYPGAFAGAGGYWDAKAKANWTFPTWKQIDEVFTKKAPSNWEAAPAEVKNMGVIGCEVCHGPANEHVKNNAKVMDASFANGVCDQCHGAAANHSKGWQLANSKHTTGTSFEEINGPARQDCVRCHSAHALASFIANPKSPASWSNEESTITCVGCHDPHDEKFAFQLRLVGKPLEFPYADKAKDVGLSALCETCHNARRNGDDFAAGKTTSYPHYSAAAEMLTDLGGVTYGATVPNSPHGMLVGNAPVPTGSTTPGSAKFKWSKPEDTKGNVPGPCVVCHMWDTVTVMTDTLAFKVGGHSFNAVTPDGKTAYGASCKSCHGDVKDFNMKAKADYDGNGQVEGVQTETKGLLNALMKQLEAKGVKKSTSSPYATFPADADQKVKNAWFNFRTVYGAMWTADGHLGNEGKASAMHNFKRTCALLQLSYKDVTGALPAGAADCTK